MAEKKGFSAIAKDVMTARKNFGAPDSMKLKDSIESKDMVGKTITIDEIIVINRVKVDKETKEIIKTKKGEDVYQAVAYVAFDGDKFFATKSAILIEQLASFCGYELVFNEKKDIVVDGVKGMTVTVSEDKVKYRDGKMYPNIIFTD